MKRILHSKILLTLGSALTLAGAISAAPIDRSTITQVVKDASVLQPATKSRKPARVNDVFSVPDVMRTGSNSRVEMIAEDQTVTRVGANTVFSFEPEKREINLQKGSILFNSPTGKGGGTIRTAAATAAVQGTTLIVVTTDNGGFKVLLQEGHGSVRTPKGRFRTLKAGQMVFALPGGDLSQTLTYQLSQQVGVSLLVGGFRKPLPSIAKIEAAVAKQEVQIAKGQLQQTGLLAGNQADKAFKVDVNSREVLIQQERGVGGIGGAGLTDAIVATPALDTGRIFSSKLAALDAVGPGVADFTLFVARNTTFLTPAIDLVPFQPTATFAFVSLQTLFVNQTVSIFGNESPLTFVAGNTITFVPGVTLFADAPEVLVLTLGSDLTSSIVAGSPGSAAGTELLLTDAIVSNPRSGGNLRISAPSIRLESGGFGSEGNLHVVSQGNLIVNDGIATVVNGVGQGRALVQLFARQDLDVRAKGDITMQRAAVYGVNTTMNAGQNFKATAVAFGVSFQGSRLLPDQAQTISLQATDLIDLNAAIFNVRDVALQAQTIALRNVDFVQGSTVSLRSQSGQLAPNPNTNQPVRLGDVNFIQNVNYGGRPAQQAVTGGSITISK